MVFGKYKKNQQPAGHGPIPDPSEHHRKDADHRHNTDMEHGHPRPKNSLEPEDLEEIFRREMTEEPAEENAERHESAGTEFFEQRGQDQAKMDILEKALQEEKDRSLRTLAELENYRRRSARELDDANKYRAMDMIREILPVMDNLARAVEAAEKQNPNDPLLAGVRMVYQQFLSALANQKCTKIEALGRPFDPNFHEAIQQFESDEPANTVLCVPQDGFLLVDRVVRPSQVVVAKPR